MKKQSENAFTKRDQQVCTAQDLSWPESRRHPGQFSRSPFLVLLVVLVQGMFFLFSAAGIAAGPPNAASLDPFSGTWEARFGVEGVEEIDILEISRSGTTLKVLYHGYEQKSDHGRFYFLVDAIDVKAKLSFTVGPRDLSCWRPKTVTKEGQRGECTGWTGRSYGLQGHIQDGNLLLRIEESPGVYHQDWLVFKKRRS